VYNEQNCVGGSLAAGRVTSGRERMMCRKNERYTGFPFWRFGMCLTWKLYKNLIVLKPRRRVGHDPKMDRRARKKKEEEEEDEMEDAGEEGKKV
jgi:hypothetical protein